MVKLQINHKDVVLLIMDYLKEQNLLKSMLALEEETNMSLFRYSKEIGFLRQLILDGNWDDVEHFLELTQIRQKIDFNQIQFEIGKQKYLELLCSQSLDQNYLVQALKYLEPLCSKEQYNGLCYLLTLKSLNDHPDFQQWTIQRGRIECFEILKHFLSGVFSSEQSEKRKTPANRMLKMLKDSVSYQYFVAKQTASMTKFRFDPVTQCSEVSLLKDLVNHDSQQKFFKQNLAEVKIAFYNRSQKIAQNRLNSLCQSIEIDEQEMPEEMDDDEEEDEDDYESHSDYYDREFAQSMPAHLAQAMVQNKNKFQKPQQPLGQSVNQNVFRGIGQPQQQLNRNQFLNEEHNKFMKDRVGSNNPSMAPSLAQSMQFGQGKKGFEQSHQTIQIPTDKNALAQQRVASDQYKSIQYQKSRQSYEQNQEFMNNSGYMSNKLNTSNSAMRNQQPSNISTNFEFQRPTHQAEPPKDSLSNQQRQMQQNYEQQQVKGPYHNRKESKGGQVQGQQPSFGNPNVQPQIEMLGTNSSGQRQKQNTYHQQPQNISMQNVSSSKIKQPINKLMSQKEELESSPENEHNTSRKQQMVQSNNFIFQNDSDQEDYEEQKREYAQLKEQIPTKIKAQPPISALQSSQKNVGYQSQQYQPEYQQHQLEDQEEIYDEDFNEHNEEEEEASENQSQQQSVRQIQQPIEKQQNYIDTEENPQQLISDIDPSIENNISNLAQRAILVDSQPIRAACFSPRGEHLALGTNSKSLKICSLPSIHSDDEDEDFSPNDKHEQGISHSMNVIFEQQDHHNGSIYCIDWSRTSRLIATGSNDRNIKILVCPDLDKTDHSQLLVMSLTGHSAIVRTVCFNPVDDLILVSGGLNDTDLKVWNSETGRNFANLKGHSGSIYSVKMSNDGSFAMSVGTDKYIRIWDVRSKASVCAIDGTKYSDMNEICFSSSPNTEAIQSSQDMNSFNGLACVAHVDGGITFWDMNMRKCLVQNIVHTQEARGVSFTVDGKYLASAGFDSQIIIQDTSDLDNLTTVKTLEHDDKVVSVKWHPFLPLLLSTSADKTARIWYPQMHQ